MCSEGSKSTSTSVDKWYNRFIAAPIALETQAMAKELYDNYKSGIGTYEYTDVVEPILKKKKYAWYNADGTLTAVGRKAQQEGGYYINEETGKLATRKYVDDPNNIGQQELEQQQITANAALLPAQTELEKLTLAEQTEATKMSGLARKKLFDTTMAGTDVRGAMGRAQADVEQGAGLAMQSARNQAFREGVDPNSSQYKKLQETLLTNKMKGIAGARTGARVAEEDKNYERLAGLSSYGL